MKMISGFFIGVIVCFLLVVSISQYTYEVLAEDNPSTLPDDMDLSSLLPDIGRIYREALGGPYRQVESEITDPDIARYFRKLMDRTGLDKIE